MQETLLEKIGLEMTRSDIKNRLALSCFKRKMAQKYKIPCPKNIALLQTYHKLKKEKRVKESVALETILTTRPVRSLSGVVNVSALTKPWPCKGKCLFCPSEKGAPQSYLKQEPAVQRAVLTKFDPHKQVMARLSALNMTGHKTDKVEIRIIGGTWDYYPKKYREWFVLQCYKACNDFRQNKIFNLAYRQTGFQSCLPPACRLDRADRFSISKQIQNPKFQNLKREQGRNETAGARVVGLSIETRPDCVNIKTIKEMRYLGITKVELGVQTTFDDTLKANKRGHSVGAIITATKTLKDAGFKVSYQIMPNLFKSNPEKDREAARQVFQNPNFKPDLMKIYPLAVLKNSPLFQLYQKGLFKPYNEQQLKKLLIAIKQQAPFWLRIERIVRDIPSREVLEGGAKISNLREIIKKEMAKQGLACHCVRCREVGADFKPGEKIALFQEECAASGGQEVFLSFENEQKTKLFALLRLRLPQETNNVLTRVFPVLKDAVIIRELHTFGPVASVGQGQTPSQLGRGLPLSEFAQHKGLGKKLVATAENIAKQQGFKKIAVISAVGVRGYYRKLGYRLKDTYMIKRLN